MVVIKSLLENIKNFENFLSNDLDKYVPYTGLPYLQIVLQQWLEDVLGRYLQQEQIVG